VGRDHTWGCLPRPPQLLCHRCHCRCVVPVTGVSCCCRRHVISAAVVVLVVGIVVLSLSSSPPLPRPSRYIVLAADVVSCLPLLLPRPRRYVMPAAITSYPLPLCRARHRRYVMPAAAAIVLHRARHRGCIVPPAMVALCLLPRLHRHRRCGCVLPGAVAVSTPLSRRVVILICGSSPLAYMHPRGNLASFEVVWGSWCC
jgi:hypothetical protein